MITIMEALLFAALSIVIALVFVPAEFHSRIRLHAVRYLRGIARFCNVAADTAEERALAGKVDLETGELFDQEGITLKSRTNRELSEMNSRLNHRLLQLESELNQLKQRLENINRTGNEYGIVTDPDGAIDIRDMAPDQASELRSMVDIEYVQDPVTGAVDQVPVKRRGRPRRDSRTGKILE